MKRTILFTIFILFSFFAVAQNNYSTKSKKAIKLYEEGVKLAKKCYSTLAEAELKIKELKEDLEKDFE